MVRTRVWCGRMAISDDDMNVFGFTGGNGINSVVR